MEGNQSRIATMDEREQFELEEKQLEKAEIELEKQLYEVRERREKLSEKMIRGSYKIRDWNDNRD